MNTQIHDAEAGTLNLIRECLGAKRGENIIVRNEDPAEGFYDAEGPAVLERVARNYGLSVQTQQVGFTPDGSRVDDALWDHICAFDHAVFFAHLGDQFRLAGKKGEKTKAIISYALDEAMLGSGYGRASHRGMGELTVVRHDQRSCGLASR